MHSVKLIPRSAASRNEPISGHAGNRLMSSLLITPLIPAQKNRHRSNRHLPGSTRSRNDDPPAHGRSSQKTNIPNGHNDENLTKSCGDSWYQTGRVCAGDRADFAIFPKSPVTITPDRLHSKCGWTPYEGMDAVFPKTVILAGDIVFESGEYHRGTCEWMSGAGYVPR